ncbi:MAG: 2-oxoacid:ferredoxin oxidoreductase subunit beta [Myxococcales bacterium]|nr:2-oxoacid:ferredoxin oxidoreductase subunit beta [Myxococcales bacterium]USN49994.1 MAG: 2-oxoacid:ferredoxin oxidoreductase subunit beta [Myxococcales bacterium]
MKGLTRKDYQNENEVRWCPGCGDYAILATVQKTLADLSIKKENAVFVSGIGCAARFPYYMNTYGLHTIHGRGPAIASGLKLARPELDVFLVTGDGDGLSIGASHLLHLIRRNIDITVLLFNNQIYGLTKGQYSPTSLRGQKAKSTPFGSLEEPINPVSFALSAGAGFVARAIDNDAVHLGNVLKAAIEHKGTSFVEIMQTCVVFNDDAFEHARDKNQKDHNVLVLKDNEPLLFAQGLKGIGFDTDKLTPILVNGHDARLMLHEPKNSLKASILASMQWPEFPLMIGVFRNVERRTYESLKDAQDKDVKARAKSTQIQDLLYGSNTWCV